jgi:hypothetical protein
MRLIGRLPRAIKLIIAATILMPASYGVFRLGANSFAKPTYKEKVQASQAKRDLGQPVAVTGTGFEGSAAVTVRITRPDKAVDTTATTVDPKGNLGFFYEPRSLAGSFVLETLGADDFGLAAASFTNGPSIQAAKGNYFAGEAPGWPELAGGLERP